MDEECVVEQMFAQVPSIDLDPGQVNLLLSSLKPIDEVANGSQDCVEVIDFSQISDCSSDEDNDRSKSDFNNTQTSDLVLDTAPLFRATPPLLSSNFKLHHCSMCDFFSLSSDLCLKHQAQDHPQRRPNIQCISCRNIFLSIYALKIHLLMDHEVLKNELQLILLLTLKKSEEFLSSTPPCSQKNNLSTSQNADHIFNKNNTDERLPSVYDSEPGIIANSLAEFSESMSAPANKPRPVVKVVHSKSNNYGHDMKDVESTTSFSGNNFFDFSSETLVRSRENSSPQNSAALSPNHISLSSSRESNSDESNYEVVDDEIDAYDDDVFSDDSDENPTSIEEATETINRHLQLMELLKKEKSKANRCRMASKCNLRFKSVNTLDYHKKCHDLSKQCWKCPECSRCFVVWNSLSLHLWNDHKIDMELYYCNFCSFRTPNLSKLKTTHIWIHGKDRMFSCPTCSKAVKTKKQLRNHMAIHKKNLIRYECKQCKALFSQCNLLRQHYEVVHQKSKRFRCNMCGHRSASRSDHDLHFRKHTKEKKYGCGECSYRSGDHNALRRHLATHSGVRPYSCPHCSYTTIHSTSLRSHVNSKHPGMLGDVVFSCPLCPFKTLRKDLFVAHSSKHNFNSHVTSKQPQLSSNQAVGSCNLNDKR